MRIWAMFEKVGDIEEFRLAGPNEHSIAGYCELKNKWAQEAPDEDYRKISYIYREMEMSEI